MKISSNLFGILILGSLLGTGILPAVAQPAPAPSADDKPKDLKAAKDVKVVKPQAFWAVTPPVATGKIEIKYDINEDGILQTSEVKILLRRVISQVMNENINFNIEDSKLLKAYDKNKDGIISKLELEDIKKDLALQQ